MKRTQEVKIGFRIVFQSKETTLTAAQIELVYNDLINQSLKIDGISIPGI
jgi:phenylalanyl-tRNA synthetase beta subunit